MQNKAIITIISQFTICRFFVYFFFLLKQENEYYSKYL
jgi:hypothetical protein